jgi:hypothetical protein
MSRLQSSCGAATIIFGVLTAVRGFVNGTQQLESIGVKVVPHTGLATGIALLKALPLQLYAGIAVVSLLGYIFLMPQIQGRFHYGKREGLPILSSPPRSSESRELRIDVDGIYAFSAGEGKLDWLTVIFWIRVTNLNARTPNRTENWKFAVEDAGGHKLPATSPKHPPVFNHTKLTEPPDKRFIGDRTIPQADHIDGLVWVHLLSPPPDVQGLIVKMNCTDIYNDIYEKTAELPFHNFNE